MNNQECKEILEGCRRQIEIGLWVLIDWKTNKTLSQDKILKGLDQTISLIDKCKELEEENERE